MRRIRMLKVVARQEALMALLFSGVGMASGVFAAVAGFGKGAVGVLWLMLAAAVIPLVWVHLCEFFKLLRLIAVEKFYEAKRYEKRP